ncbi:hypothetical protein [Salsipaludibacter albus]|uniref:hypothetical protein n=1 Tax=Salsipaludibacter albus TaxID=2849650 RepID=UPI001EE3EE51|nr:hypothetical protein [Salsipaludibacter albus]MBY5163277.1 hypothetical protein [Salsipaludibacter albus]
MTGPQRVDRLTGHIAGETAAWCLEVRHLAAEAACEAERRLRNGVAGGSALVDLAEHLELLAGLCEDTAGIAGDVLASITTPTRRNPRR